MLPYPLIKLESPVEYLSLAGNTFIQYKIITPIPKELIANGTIDWKVCPLKSDRYDGIIGINFLKSFKAVIDTYNNYITIFNTYIIPFYNSQFPPEISEVSHLEPIENVYKEVGNQIESNQNLNSEEFTYLKKILVENKDLFFQEGDNLTCTDEIQHEIKLSDDRPTYAKTYRYPQIHEEEIKNQIAEMLRQGIIRESNSPFNSPLWIVEKKRDNSNIKKWRIVIDYRKLNLKTVEDKFPIPNIDQTLDRLGKAQYFSTLDLAKGFHQVLVKEEDRCKTAFSTPYGHYEYVRMPFGLKNAPSTFQRLINLVLRKYINKICVVYMDDILVFSTGIEEHYNNLKTIFKALRKANLKLQVDKCNFLKRETEYLGHILTTDGIKPNPNKIKNIVSLNLPTNAKQIKSFLGVSGYYRKFIKDYAKIAQPLTKYLKKDAKINTFDPTYIHAFEQLKQLITTHPILRYPDFDKTFTINTDASNYALGAVLLQDGHPVYYASRTLNNHEINYSTVEKELLAIVWAVKFFRPYIFGKEFIVNTDHQAIKWLHNKYMGKDLNPRLQRWILSLGECKIKIYYVHGKDNNIADFLSRINCDSNEINELTDLPIENENVLENDNVSNIATVHSQEESDERDLGILETVVNRFKYQLIITQNGNNQIKTIFNHSRLYLNSDQSFDSMKHHLNSFIKINRIAIYSEIQDTKFFQIKKFLFSNYPTTKFIKCTHFAKDVEEENEIIKLVSIYHKEMNHPGITALYEMIKHKIYNKELKLIINKITNYCDICNSGKYDRNPIKPLFLQTEIPIDKNHIIHVDTYVNSKQSFIVFIDKFTKFAAAYPLENRTHIEIIEKLKMYFIHKRAKKLIADNEFKHINIKEFLQTENIELHLVKPNCHTGNSDIERFNNTITEKLRILKLESTKPIREHMLEAIKIYNSQFHSTIQTTPNIAEEGKISDKIYNLLMESQRKRLAKHNRNREDYIENREEGFIKNYKSLRHKNEPKFRKHNLTNIHLCNIKRKPKFVQST